MLSILTHYPLELYNATSTSAKDVMLDTSFYRKLASMSEELGMNPRDLLLVMFFESGLNPAAKNPHGGAAGLIQFMPATLRGMGVNPKGFGNKSATEQLDYVKQFIRGKQAVNGGRTFTSATQYYHANFFPLTLARWKGSDPVRNRNVVVVSGKSSSQQERAAYKENKVLDTNSDGEITVGDLTATLLRAEKSPQFKQALSQLNSVAGQGSISEHSRSRKPNPTPNSSDSSIMPFISKLDKLLDTFMGAAASTTFAITADADLSSKLEYASILKSALKEELSIGSEIHTDVSNVSIVCNSSNQPLILAIAEGVSDAFTLATKKIGSIKVTAIASTNIPNLTPLDADLASIHYRTFRLKFAKGSNEDNR